MHTYKTKHTKRYIADTNGVAAIETALAFPLVIFAMFAVMKFSLVFYDISQVQKSLEHVSRKIVFLEEPTLANITNLVEDNIYSPNNAVIEIHTSMSSKYDAEFANVSATYIYDFNLPYSSRYLINKTMAISVMITK